MKLESVHFISGDDEFLVSKAAKDKFLELSKDLTDDFAKETINALAGNADDVARAIDAARSSIETLSLFGDAKVIWLKDVNFLADNQVSKSEACLEKVAQLQESLARIDANSVTVIIGAYPVDRRKKLVKWFPEHCQSTHISAGKEKSSVLQHEIRKICSEAKIEITQGALELIDGKVNGSIRMACKEAEKLALYLDEEGSTREITEQLVADLVPVFGEGDFFEAAEAFFNFNLKQALNALDRHFYTINEARPLISSMQKRNRLLIQLRVLIDSGELSVNSYGIAKGSLENAGKIYAEIYKGLDNKTDYNVFSQNPWYLGRLIKAAQKCTIPKLIGFQNKFLSAFEKILANQQSQHSIMREVVVSCLG